MAKNDDRNEHADAANETSTRYGVSVISAEIAVTSAELSLRRAVHKIAWQRMHGKNDAMNPYCDPPPSVATPGGSGEHAMS